HSLGRPLATDDAFERFHSRQGQVPRAGDGSRHAAHFLLRTTPGAATREADLDENVQSLRESRVFEYGVDKRDGRHRIDQAVELEAPVALQLLCDPADRGRFHELVGKDDPAGAEGAPDPRLADVGHRQAPRPGIELHLEELRRHMCLYVWRQRDAVSTAVCRHLIQVVAEGRILQDHDWRHEIAAKHVPALLAHGTDAYRIGRWKGLVAPVDGLVEESLQV